MDLERKLLEGLGRTLHAHGMLPEGTTLLVACSGGPDSLALLRLLLLHRDEFRPGLRIAVAHLDHGLRGEQGAADARFVAGLAAEFQLPFRCAREDVAALSRARSLSLEEGARAARYQFLARAAYELGCGRIATGHTREDAAETLLLRLARGAGRRGLGGLRPVQGMVVRPLVELSRTDLRGWLDARGFPYRLDPTNEDLRFARNRVRRTVLPALEEAFGPGVARVLARTSRILDEEDELLDALTEEAAEGLVRGCGRSVTIEREGCARLPRPLRHRVLRRALAQVHGGARGLAACHVEMLDRLLLGQGGAADLPGGLRAEPEGAGVRLGPRPERTPPFRYPLAVPGAREVPEAGAVLEATLRSDLPSADALRALPPEEAWLDAAKAGRELEVRSRLPGDRFRPLGLGGRSRKIQDVLVDRKVPRAERDTIPLVLARGELAWVPGVGVAEPFRVDAGTPEGILLRLRRTRG